MCKIKSKLIEKRKDEVGFLLHDGYFIEWPKIGSHFNFYIYFNNILSIINTGKIEIMDDSKIFESRNRFYQILTIEDERDQKIDKILEK